MAKKKTETVEEQVVTEQTDQIEEQAADQVAETPTETTVEEPKPIEKESNKYEGKVIFKVSEKSNMKMIYDNTNRTAIFAKDDLFVIPQNRPDLIAILERAAHTDDITKQMQALWQM